MPERNDAVDSLVESQFNDYRITSKTKSNNGRHYIMQKDGATFHLKLVSKKYVSQNVASEIELLKRIDSEYVVKLLDSGELNREWDYLLFPHINGQTLDKLTTPEGWADNKFNDLFHDVIEGFKALNAAGVIHRDIKPKNIMYDNVNHRYVILDLGIGCFAKNPTKDTTMIPKGQIGAGAKFYTAPEQFKISIGEPYSTTHATDQFSLGVIAYELAVNEHPFITRNDENRQYYANLVFEKIPTQIPARDGLSESTRKTIMRMLQREQADRFLTNKDLMVSYGTDIEDDPISESKIFIKLPKDNKEEAIRFAVANADTISGIILTPTDSQANADIIEAAGVRAILDTSVFRLQTEKDKLDLSSKLNIPYTASHNMLTLYRIQDELLLGVYELADKMHSDTLILPYFKMDSDESLRFTKEIWSSAKTFYAEKSMSERVLYGGLIIPHSKIINADERSKFMSQIMGSYDIHGLLVTFEDPNANAATTVSSAYLEGVKILVDFFEKQFNDVIVTRTDISVLPLLNSSSYVGGWSKSFRHFQASASGGGGGHTDYKMKYWVPKLFTFIEEKSLIRQIVTLGFEDTLRCECTFCQATNPLNSGYTEEELPERGHYYSGLTLLQSELNGKTHSQRKTYFIDYLNECSVDGEDIKSASAIGNETIPSYVSLVSIINR